VDVERAVWFGALCLALQEPGAMAIAHRCVRHPDQCLCVQFVPFTIPGYEYMIVLHDDLDPRDGALVSFEHEE
jgi:hypothetical protein